MNEHEDKVKQITVETSERTVHDERATLLENGILIEHPHMQRACKILDHLADQPKRPRMEGKSFIGPTNNGKSFTVDFWINERRKKEKNSSKFDYVHVDLPEIPSVKSLYSEILIKLHLPINAIAGTAEQLKHKVTRLFSELHVKMLFIDEVHNLLGAQSERIKAQCLNALKGLSNRLQIPIVLIGTDAAADVIKSDTQVLNRFRIINFKPWEKGEDFDTLLNTFEANLHLRNPSNLSSPKLSTYILKVSEGKIGEISTLLSKAAIKAIERGTEKLTLDLLKETYEELNEDEE